MEQYLFASSPCRLCLKNCELQTRIFGKIGRKLGIHFKIKACFPSLNVDQDDGLPDSICYRCLCSLDQTYTFWTKCCSSEARLRNIGIKKKCKKKYNWVTPEKTINPYEVISRRTSVDSEECESDDWCIWDARYRNSKNQIYPSQSCSLKTYRQDLKQDISNKMILCDKTIMKPHQVGEALHSDIYEFDDWFTWDARYRICDTREYPSERRSYLESFRTDTEVPNQLILFDEVTHKSGHPIKPVIKPITWKQEANAKEFRTSGKAYTSDTRSCSDTSMKGITKSVVPTTSSNFASKFWMQKPMNKTGLIHERKPMNHPPLISTNVLSCESRTDAKRKMSQKENSPTKVTKKFNVGTDILQESKKSCSLGDQKTPFRKNNMPSPSQCNQMFTCAKSIFDRLGKYKVSHS